MRKRLLLILGCVAAVLLAGYVTLRLTAPRQLNEKNMLLICADMTEQQVQDMLGAPAGAYSANAVTGLYGLHRIIGAVPNIQTGLDLIQQRGGKEWVGERRCVYIRFDESGRVIESRAGQTFLTRDESFLTKLRRWLGM